MKFLRYPLALIVLAALYPLVPAGGGDEWLELRTANFVLVGNAPRDKTQEVGTTLERLRQTLDVFPGNLDQTPRTPLTIYVFRDWGSSKRLLPGTGYDDRPGGLFFRNPDAAYIVLHAERGLDVASLASHEYLHFVLEQNFPAVPLWLSEGLCEVFGTFRATEHEAEIGLPVEPYQELVRRRPLAPERMFRVNTTSWEYREPRLKQQFHAQSWAMTHYLMFRAGETADLGGILARLQDGEPAGEVFPDLAENMPDFSAHFRASRGRLLRVGLESAKERKPEIRVLPRDEVSRRRADLLLFQSSKQAQRAERLYRKALDFNERNARAHAGLARLHAREGRTSAAISRLRRAVALDPDDGTIGYFLARLLLREQSRGEASDDPPDARPRLVEIRKLLEGAVASAPGFVDPKVALGLTWLLLDPVSDQGIETLERVLEQDPYRADALYYLYSMRLERGEFDSARELEPRIRQDRR